MSDFHNCTLRGCPVALKFQHEMELLVHLGENDRKIRSAGRPRLKVRRIALDLKTPRGIVHSITINAAPATFPPPRTADEIAENVLRNMERYRSQG